MPKPIKKPCAAWTGSNFYEKCGDLALPRVQQVPRSTSIHGTPSITYSLSPCSSPSLPRSPAVARSPSVPRTPLVPHNTPVPRVPYVPRSIRVPNSYGPRIQKYDDYINIFNDSDDSDKDLSSRKNDQNQEKPAKGNKPTTKYELGYRHEKTSRGPTKAPSKPIIHCYNTETTSKDILGNPLTPRKSAPIKKISFVLPGCKKPLNTEHMDWKDFHKLNVIYQFMDDLETSFPSICTTTIIGKSVEGRDLKILKVSNSNASNVAVWIDSGIHAREWIAPAVNTYIANHIIRNFDNLPESVRNKDWYFLPIVNPDGYHHSHSIDRMWRKNRALHNGVRSGVDLNRNFCLGWGRRGSSNKPHNAFYRGPHPFSEPESSAMRDMLLNSGINFKVYITLHCYGQIIIFPYSFTSEMAPDYVRLLEGATTMSKAIYNTNGSTYKVGVSKDVMYSASGTSNDFAHGYAGIPYCYLIELRSKKYKFRLPKEQIEETGKEILNSVLALVEYIDNYPYQDRVEQNIDSLLENDSFLKSSFIDSSDRKRLTDYKKSKYSYPKKIDSSNDSQGSFIKLTHSLGERADSREDIKCSGSLENVNEYFFKNKHTPTSKKQTSLAQKDRSTNTQYSTDYGSENESDLENNYTSTKTTDAYKKFDRYLPDSIEDGNESVSKKMYISEKGTNSSMEVNDYLPDSFNNGNESVLKKNYTSEKETNPYKKVNKLLPDFFDDDEEYLRNKTNTSEKETDTYKDEDQYYDTINESDLLWDDVRYGSKQETVPSKKVDQYVPGPSEIGIQSDLEMDYPSEKEINRIEKIKEYLPDFLFEKSDLKIIGTPEKGTNLNNKIDKYLSDSFTSKKEFELKKIYPSRGKKESFKKVIQYLPDSIDGEKEYNLNKINASAKETNTSEKEYMNDLDDSLLFRSDSFINKIESFKTLSDASGGCVEPSETNSIIVKEDSFEAWNSFYERKSNFDRMRSSLLLKTDNTFASTDIQWYLYFDMF